MYTLAIFICVGGVLRTQPDPDPKPALGTQTTDSDLLEENRAPTKEDLLERAREAVAGEVAALSVPSQGDIVINGIVAKQIAQPCQRGFSRTGAELDDIEKTQSLRKATVESPHDCADRCASQHDCPGYWFEPIRRSDSRRKPRGNCLPLRPGAYQHNDTDDEAESTGKDMSLFAERKAQGILCLRDSLIPVEMRGGIDVAKEAAVKLLAQAEEFDYTPYVAKGVDLLIAATATAATLLGGERGAQAHSVVFALLGVSGWIESDEMEEVKDQVKALRERVERLSAEITKELGHLHEGMMAAHGETRVVIAAQDLLSGVQADVEQEELWGPSEFSRIVRDLDKLHKSIIGSAQQPLFEAKLVALEKNERTQRGRDLVQTLLGLRANFQAYFLSQVEAVGMLSRMLAISPAEELDARAFQLVRLCRQLQLQRMRFDPANDPGFAESLFFAFDDFSLKFEDAIEDQVRGPKVWYKRRLRTRSSHRARTTMKSARKAAKQAKSDVAWAGSSKATREMWKFVHAVKRAAAPNKRASVFASKASSATSRDLEMRLLQLKENAKYVCPKRFDAIEAFVRKAVANADSDYDNDMGALMTCGNQAPPPDVCNTLAKLQGGIKRWSVKAELFGVALKQRRSALAMNTRLKARDGIFDLFAKEQGGLLREARRVCVASKDETVPSNVRCKGKVHRQPQSPAREWSRKELGSVWVAVKHAEDRLRVLNGAVAKNVPEFSSDEYSTDLDESAEVDEPDCGRSVQSESGIVLDNIDDILDNIDFDDGSSSVSESEYRSFSDPSEAMLNDVMAEFDSSDFGSSDFESSEFVSTHNSQTSDDHNFPSTHSSHSSGSDGEWINNALDDLPMEQQELPEQKELPEPTKSYAFGDHTAGFFKRMFTSKAKDEAAAKKAVKDSTLAHARAQMPIIEEAIRTFDMPKKPTEPAEYWKRSSERLDYLLKKVESLRTRFEALVCTPGELSLNPKK